MLHPVRQAVLRSEFLCYPLQQEKYKKLRLHIYRYESGKLSDQDKVEMGFEDIGSQKVVKS